MPSKVPPSAAPAELPATGFIRQRQLLSMLPFSATTLWRRVRARTFPEPVRLSPKVTAWRVEDVRAWLADQVAAAPARLGTDCAPPARRRGRHTLAQSADLERWSARLLQEANAWRDAETIRAYVDQVLTASVAGGGRPAPALREWAKAARAAADRLDPTFARRSPAGDVVK